MERIPSMGLIGPKQFQLKRGIINGFKWLQRIHLAVEYPGTGLAVFLSIILVQTILNIFCSQFSSFSIRKTASS